MRTQMRRRKARVLAAAIAVVLAIGQASAAAELAGVTLPDEVTIEGRNLHLQGLGIRKKFLFKVYVGGLYLATPTQDAGEAIRAEEPKRIVMHFLRDVGEAKIREAFDEGFFNNSQELLNVLRERIESFHQILAGGMEKGQEATFTYLPGEGTRVRVDGDLRGTIEGDDFMQALWSVWLGQVPADHELKRKMLGL